MSRHFRANLWLALLTLLSCSVLYPTILWVIGQAAFPHRAEGSMHSQDGKPVGSHLIAQPFSAAEYFHPRPSAVSYNASASGGSNLAASNYLLRDRVARVGPIAKFRDGQPVAPHIEKWFATKPGLVAEWATAHPGVAKAWVNADPSHAKVINDWKQTHSDAVAEGKSVNMGEPAAADLAVAFFTSFAKEQPRSWPKGSGDPLWSVPAVFFDRWLQAHPQADLQPVPADMVTTSGSGLDPHITLKNALYQLDRVAAAWARKTNLERATVRKEIEALLDESKDAPLGGLFGVPLVNVLEVNLALQSRIARLTAAQ